MTAHDVMEALAYASIAAVLTVAGRSFGTLNLSAGAWVTVGTWLGFYVANSSASTTSVRASGFTFLLMLAVAQSASAMLLRRSVIERPLAFVLVTLGCSRAAEAISTRWLLSSSQVRVPPDAIPVSVALIGIALAVAAVVWAKNSKWINRTAARVRTSDNQSPVWRHLSLVLFAELVLLVSLGTSLGSILRGVPANEFLTIVPVLAVCAARFNTIVAMIIACASVLGMRYLEGGPLATGADSVGVILLVLAAAVVLRYRPTRFIGEAQRVEVVMPRWIGFKRSQLLRTPLSAVVLSALLLGGALLASNPTRHGLNRALYVLALTVCAGRAAQALGIRSIGWPVLAGIGALAGGLWDWTPVTPVLLLGMLGCFGVYTVILRSLPAAASLVVDVASIVAIVQIAGTRGIFGGTEGTRQLVGLGAGWPAMWVATFLTIVIIALWTVLPWITRGHRGRALILGIANLANGQLNGQRTAALLVVGSSIIALGAMLSGLGFAADTATLSERDVSVSAGMIVLLIASLLQWLPFAVSWGASILLFGFVERMLAGRGAVLDLVVGLALATVAVLTSTKAETER